MDTIKIQDKKTTKMIAHRGVSKLERENTCPAFIAAGNRSYFGIETDIQVIADGTFVAMHDDDTRRVCLDKVYVDIIKGGTWDTLRDVVLLYCQTHKKDKGIDPLSFLFYISLNNIPCAQTVFPLYSRSASEKLTTTSYLSPNTERWSI